MNFARSVRSFLRKLPKSLANLHDARQLIRTSSALGARYVEAGGAPNRQEFLRCILEALQSARASAYWLHVLDTGDYEKACKEREMLLKEANALQRIFGAIAAKVRSNARSTQA